MSAVCVASGVVVLWVLQGVGGAVRSREVDARGSLQSSGNDKDSMQHIPGSQRSTESLMSWPLLEGSPSVAASTRPLTGLPWSSALPATPSIPLDGLHSPPAPSHPLLHYLVPDSLATGASFTSAPGVLSTPLRRPQQSSPLVVTKMSGVFEEESFVRPVQSPFPLLRTLKNFESNSDSSEENYNQEIDRKNDKSFSERNSQFESNGDSSEEDYDEKINRKNYKGSSERNSQADFASLVSSVHNRAATTIYEVPVPVQSYGPTSHFFLHELLAPRHQPTLEEPKHQPTLEEPKHHPILEELKHQPTLEDPKHHPILEIPEHQTFLEKPKHQPTLEEPKHQPFLEELKHQPTLEEPKHHPIQEEPKHKFTVARDAGTVTDFRLNTDELPPTSAPIFYPSSGTTNSPAHIVFPDDSSFPSTVADSASSTVPPLTEAPSRQNMTVTTHPPLPDPIGIIDNRVIISVPCHGPCRVAAGRVCVTDFSCLGEHLAK